MKKSEKNNFDLRKKLSHQFDPHHQYQKLASYQNAAHSSLYQTDYHEKFEVNIIPDTSIARGAFFPTLNPREYKAHPITISAVRKEIFMGGDEFVDLECLHICQSCMTEIDLQFWHFCPFCEASFSS